MEKQRSTPEPFPNIERNSPGEEDSITSIKEARSGTRKKHITFRTTSSIQ